jgi:hypothetical protein
MYFTAFGLLENDNVRELFPQAYSGSFVRHVCRVTFVGRNPALDGRKAGAARTVRVVRAVRAAGSGVMARGTGACLEARL